MIERISDGEPLLKLNRGMYEPEAVIQTSYKFTDRCYIHIDTVTEDVTEVHFKLKHGNIASLEEIINEFCNELVDQQLRVIVERRFGSIRDEIVKKAFSPIDGIK